MGSFSFKSSGLNQAQQIANKLAAAAVPIGIKTPLALGTDDLLVTNSDLATQWGDNLRNLVLTNWGERLGFYDYGANLRPLVTDFVTQDDFDSQAVERIRSAVTRWMPYIDLQSFLSEVDRTQNKNTGVIQLTVTYDIPSLNITNKRLQVSLYVI